MFFKLKTLNAKELYPVLYAACEAGYFKYSVAKDRETKAEYMSIDLKNIEDLMSILSLAQATDEYITGYYITGNTIEFTQKPYSLGE